MPQQPQYALSEYKLNARQTNINMYRKITGRQAIPVSKQYWTLCNEQPPISSSEIEQLVSLGFCTKSQFHGVDRCGKIVSQNQQWHPAANWYDGDWLEIIERNDFFDPAFVYLDTTNFADNYIASDTVGRTMMCCRPGTVLFANLMLNDPRSRRRFNPDQIIDNLRYKIPPRELSQWNKNVPNYQYSVTGKTTMITYIFHKP